MTVRILRGDCREVLRTLPAESVHCVVTSPPYYGLRDYGVVGQLGLEESPDDFIDGLVAVFREVRRVLRADGTAWVNMGDSYNAHPGQRKPTDKVGAKQETNAGSNTIGSRNVIGLKPKDLIGVPWMLAFALRADGWFLRQDIVWSKPNPMPESVRDRCTKAHEYLFLLAKAGRYYFDATSIAEDAKRPEGPGNINHAHSQLGIYPDGAAQKNLAKIGPRETANKRSVWTVNTKPFAEAHFATFPPALIEPCILAGTSSHGCCPTCRAPWVLDTGRPCEKCGEFIAFQGKSCEACGHVRDWKAERGVSEALAAADWSSPGRSVPRKLGESGKQGAVPSQERMDRGWKPSCSCEPEKPIPCTVLDPFGGAGTTGLVADRLQRDAILIELNPEYAAMAEKRIRGDAPLFADVA